MARIFLPMNATSAKLADDQLYQAHNRNEICVMSYASDKQAGFCGLCLLKIAGWKIAKPGSRPGNEDPVIDSHGAVTP